MNCGSQHYSANYLRQGYTRLNRHSLDLGLNLEAVNPRFEEKIPVTVCVALLTDNRNNVVGVSDRMVTGGDIEFEPAQPKIVQLTTSMAVLTAGDSSLNAEIVADIREYIGESVIKEPTKWVSVSKVAKKYREIAGQISARNAALSLLTPLGLDSESFLSRQKDLAPELVNKLTTELLYFESPHFETIITGVDETGGHIFVVDNNSLTCYDKLGFACTGAGKWHASSQLMFDCYGPNVELPIAMFEAYVAKKRAEVAPGVGGSTDMFTIVQAGTYTETSEIITTELESRYNIMRHAEKGIQATLKGEWIDYVKAKVEEAVATQQQEQEQLTQGETPSDGDPPPDKKPVRRRTKKG